MKPKEALVKDGFLPPGSENKRGRLSGDAIERCKVLAAQGWQIEGYQVSAPTVAMSTAGAMAAQVTKVKTDPNRLVDVPDMRRDERDWTARVTVDGKSREIGFRTVDNGCGNSLGWCYCPTSRVWVDSNREAAVEFVSRTRKGG